MINCLEIPKRLPKSTKRRRCKLEREIAEMEKLLYYLNQLIAVLKQERR